MESGNERLERWQRHSELPLVSAALVFLAAYAWPILDTGLAQHWQSVCWALTWITWAVFVADYAVRLSLARHRLAYARANLLDLAIILLPALRPLRLLRLITVVHVLNRRLEVSLRKNVTLYATVTSCLVLFCAALALLKAERGVPGATVATFEDALWWSAVTVTTVGYGDFYPVTTTGRLIAVGLFLGGIALLGVVTGTLTSWFVEKVDESHEATTATRAEVEALTAEVRALRAELTARGGRDTESAGGPD
ncbi:potassium channel family protein [Allosalinactinospora lopnorensis]|uniref:potassium channel family protein n=1 Tax=Allosalinactinospora lopnorensis TaxID=1352348 RepID=UPI000623D169|nr:potassium channel family protein [Allosalinactinospora lopnorensis]